MKIDLPDRDDILHFSLTIEPDEGMYRGGRFVFDFNINQNFPHDPPKVKCKQKIYHPNIDLDGNVCLNILREDWKPVLNLNAVIVGLQVGFYFCLWRRRNHFCQDHPQERGSDDGDDDTGLVSLPRTQCGRSPQQRGLGGSSV